MLEPRQQLLSKQILSLSDRLLTYGCTEGGRTVSGAGKAVQRHDALCDCLQQLILILQTRMQVVRGGSLSACLSKITAAVVRPAE